MTEHREQTIKQLVEEMGTTREGAEFRLLDDDLWMLHPGSRYEFPVGEDSVEEWRGAVAALEDLYWASQSLGNRAFIQALSDAHERAIEALYRARQRVQEEGEEAR